MEYLKKTNIYDKNELDKFIKKASIYILHDPVAKSEARSKEHKDLFLFDNSEKKPINDVLLNNYQSMVDGYIPKQFIEQDVKEIELEPLLKNLSTVLSNDINKPIDKIFLQKVRTQIDNVLFPSSNNQEILCSDKLESEVIAILTKAKQLKSENEINKGDSDYEEKTVFPKYNRRVDKNPVEYLEKYVGKYISRYNGQKGDFFYNDDLLLVFGRQYRKNLDLYLYRSGLKYKDYVPQKRDRIDQNIARVLDSDIDMHTKISSIKYILNKK